MEIVDVEHPRRMDTLEGLEIDIHATCWIHVPDVLPPQQGALD